MHHASNLQRFWRTPRNLQWRHTPFIAGVSAMLVTLAIRLTQLPTPYWFDESNTLYYIEQPLPRMMAFIANDFSPPAYYLLLRVWVALVGTSETATGVLSLSAMVGATALTWGFTREFFGRQRAFWAAVVLWVSQAGMAFSTETRMYALLMLLTVATTWLLLLQLRQPDHHWFSLGYAALVLAGGYTHYVFWFLVLAQHLFVGWWLLRTRNWSFVRRWLMVDGLIVLAYLPQVPILWERVTGYYLPGGLYLHEYGKASLELFWRLPYELFFPVSRFIPVWFVTVTAVVMGGIFAAAYIPWVRQLHRHHRFPTPLPYVNGLAVCTFSLFVPLLVLYWLKVQVTHYAAVLTPLVSVVLAQGIANVRSRFLQAATGVGFITLLVSAQLYHAATIPLLYESGYWPAVARLLSLQPQLENTVIVANYDSAVALSRYYDGPLPIIRLMPVGKAADRPLEEIRGIGRTRTTAENVAELLPLFSHAVSVWFAEGPSHLFYDRDHQVESLLIQSCLFEQAYEFPHPTPGSTIGRLRLVNFSGCHFLSPRSIPES